MKTKTVHDSFGPIEMPAERRWGAQTQRSLQNFDIGDHRFGEVFIRALALVKAAAAQVNREAGRLPEALGRAIEEAAAQVADGMHGEEFPLSVWQTGSGTQTNMNANEVLANIAREALEAADHADAEVHPNDHVNLGQSSNDVFPTAMHVASALVLSEQLWPELDALIDAFDGHAEAHRDLVKIGRTHLQDATPIALGQEISGWAAQLRLARRSLEAASELVHELAIGGTAVGTGLNTFEGFDRRVCAALEAQTGLPFRAAANKPAALAGHDAMVALSGALRQLATALLKVANDVRWLASGPRCGLGELSIPANEPGSSIMPGKVNPTQAEALTMVCARVFGNDATVGFAGSQGNFELNVYKPVIVHAVLESARLLADAMRSFRTRCVDGLTPNVARIDELRDRSLMLVTALAPRLGYDAAARAAKKAHEEGLTLKQAVLALDLLDEATFDEIVVPSQMIAPAPPPQT